jgi:hypothetical protein
VLYDSRASVYEKQNRLKDALRDAKTTIDMAPAQWHGYFRSARLFASLNKSAAALRMCSLALERLGDDAKHEGRRRELTALRCQLEAQTRCWIAGMPVELLLIVFDLACRPVALSHVCRRWREIALSHPTLWHSLVLAESPKKALRKIQEWRKRSRGRIAELTIRKSLGGVALKPWGAHDAMHPDDLVMRSGILAELRRLDLAHVKACYLEDVDLTLFLKPLWGDLHSPSSQCLETLSASHSSFIDAQLGRNESSIPSWANLRALRVINMTCHWPAFTKFVRGLTSFECKISGHPIQFEPILSLMQANPTLEKLVVETNICLPSYIIDVPETLTMAHLRHCELSGLTLPLFSIRHLSLPSLQVLRLSMLQGSTMLLQDLVDDPGTSFAELVELTMKNCSIEAQPLIVALFCSPRLQVLQLKGDFDANAVTEALSKPYSTPPLLLACKTAGLLPTELPILCPSLDVLDLSGSPSLRTGPVMRVVKERVALAASQDGGRYRLPGQDDDQRVSCIGTLILDDCPHIEAEMLPWFRKTVPRFRCRYATTKTKERRVML